MTRSLFRIWQCLFLASLASTLVNGVPLQRRMVVHDRRNVAPRGYTHQGPATDDEMLHMSISLAMRDSSGLEQVLLRASDPKSSSYGQWLSHEEVQSYSSPSQDVINAVSSWLQSHGVDAETTRLSGDLIKFKIPIRTANQMLNTEYSVYAHTESGRKSVRTLEYSVPEDLQDHIVAIHPTTSFYRPSSAARTVTLPGYNAEQSDSSFSNSTLYRRAGPLDMSETQPAVLHKLYGLPTLPIAKSKSGIAVVALDDRHANKADLAAWLKKWRPDLPQSITFSEEFVNTAHNSQILTEADEEVNMDIQYTVGLANGIPTTFLKVGEDYHDHDFAGVFDLVDHLLQKKNPPSVLTSSFGFDREEMLTKPQSEQLCNAFQQLTVRGVSIIWASGDEGVAGGGDPENHKDCNGKAFVPTFPTCPFVTLVGATKHTKQSPEVGFELSAGGFSNYFPQPQWQKKAVDAYLAKIGPKLYKGLYNPKGRAYPDVSARGDYVAIRWQGQDIHWQGTSTSAPIFASVIALLNHELTSKGKPPMGFLNPWIYSHPQAFNDIKSGNNPGCGTPGFHALPGWDPVTGMGTPNYPAMKKALGL